MSQVYDYPNIRRKVAQLVADLGGLFDVEHVEAVMIEMTPVIIEGARAAEDKRYWGGTMGFRIEAVEYESGDVFLDYLLEGRVIWATELRQ